MEVIEKKKIDICYEILIFSSCFLGSQMEAHQEVPKMVLITKVVPTTVITVLL